jgi:hypothetical protein
MRRRDPSLDTLLLLDGERFVVDADGMCWVKFAVKQVVASNERPHGLRYSLTLHDEDGERLVGFDNAHPIRESEGPGAETRIQYDHRHSGDRVRFYSYQDAATLLADFWAEVEVVLQKRTRR